MEPTDDAANSQLDANLVFLVFSSLLLFVLAVAKWQQKHDPIELSFCLLEFRRDWCRARTVAIVRSAYEISTKSRNCFGVAAQSMDGADIRASYSRVGTHECVHPPFLHDKPFRTCFTL